MGAPQIDIREADRSDFRFVIDLMIEALAPYYGGDHQAHAERIFSAHIEGGLDHIGHFSFEQKMFVSTVNGRASGMFHLVGKRQGNYKISPIIVHPSYRGRHGMGSRLLAFGENYAREHQARQLYCTVAQENGDALQFFLRNGFVPAGRSKSHYKEGITEVMLYKMLAPPEFEADFDRPHISIMPCEDTHELQARTLLSEHLPRCFLGIDERWMDALFDGYRRRNSRDVNQKYKLIFVAIDREDRVLGVAGATPKKGTPIKLMPFVAPSLPAFVGLLTDLPYQLQAYGHKLYLHIDPSVQEAIALQQRGWVLDAVMPGAYHEDRVTQQWSFELGGGSLMRMMRVKQAFLNDIRNGRKTLEVRVGYPNIRTIRVGERIQMASRADSQVVRVRDVRRYQTHEEMLGTEDYERIAPDLRSKDQTLSLLREIYPPSREELGVVVLELEPEKEV